MKLQPLRTNPFNWLECRPTGKINPLRLLSADRYDAYTSDFNCNCLDFRIANRSAEIYAHTTFARSSTWKIVCKISFLILLSATVGWSVVVFEDRGWLTIIGCPCRIWASGCISTSWGGGYISTSWGGSSTISWNCSPWAFSTLTSAIARFSEDRNS